MKNNIIGKCVLGLVLVIALSLAYCVGQMFTDYFDEGTISQQEALVPIGQIKSDKTFVQTITPEGNRVTSFSVLFATYNRENDTDLTVSLISDGAVIYKETINTSVLEDNTYKEFLFDEPLEVNGKSLSLEFSSNSDSDDNAVTIWQNPDSNSYAGGALFLNGKELTGDICFTMNFKHEVTEAARATLFRKYLIVFSIIFVTVGVITFLAVWTKKSFFNVLVDYRYIIVGVLFVMLVVFKVHGFSVNIWESQLWNYDNSLENVTNLWGIQRPITSDTYGITLPQIFSQCDSGFPMYNYSISSSGANAVIYGLPVWDITAIGRPAFWGYLLLGKEMGLSWFYWFRTFGFLLATYEVCMMLTKKNKLASFISAFLFAFSPIVQWWNCHNIGECILYGQMLLIGGYIYLENVGCLWKKLLGAFLTFISAVGFVLLLYPAILVPFGYLVLLIAVVTVIRYVREGTRFKKSDIIIAGVTVVAALAVIGRFLINSANDIELMTSTVFPGERLATGGELVPEQFTVSFFQWRLPFDNVTMNLNNCEASQIIPVTVPILIAFPYVIGKDKENKLRNRALYFFLVFCCAWLVFTFPEWFAKITLMSNVTPNRLMWTVGILTLYLLAIMIDFFKRQCVFSWKKTVVITGGVLALMLYSVQNYYRFFEHGDQVRDGIIAAVILAAICVTLLRGYIKAFVAVALVFTVISTVRVQPVNVGVTSIYDNTLSEKICDVRDNDPDAMWLVMDGFFGMSNYPLFHNIKVFNATNLYPDYDKWKYLDPDLENEFYYNRYCQVTVSLSEEKNYFELLNLDHIKIWLALDDLKDLPIKYVLTRDMIDDDGISVVDYDEQSGYFIYGIRENV